MVIDGRELEQAEIIRQLKGLFAEHSSTDDMSLDVLVASRDDALKIGAFSKMSGLKIGVKRSDGHFKVHLSGCLCRCC